MKTNNNTLNNILTQVLNKASDLDAQGVRHTTNSTIKDTVKKHTRIAIAKTIVTSDKIAQATVTTGKILKSHNGRYILKELVKGYIKAKVDEYKEELAQYGAEQEQQEVQQEEQVNTNEYTI